MSVTSKAVNCICDQSGVWLELCQRAGKLSPFLGGDDGRTDRTYRELYWSTIVVPTEAKTIQEAVGRAVKYDKKIVLLPGTYEESVDIDSSDLPTTEELTKEAQDLLAYPRGRKRIKMGDRFRCQRLAARVFDLKAKGIDLTICASDPRMETAIALCLDGLNGEEEECPAIWIHGVPTSSISRVKLSLVGLAIRQSMPGSDQKWNAAVIAERNSDLVMKHCSITSLSGSGIRVRSGASASIAGCSIFNCASHGLRASGLSTTVTLEGCNILGNGHGFGGGYNKIDGEKSLHFLQRMLTEDPILGSSVGGEMIGPGKSGLCSNRSTIHVKNSLITRSCNLNTEVHESAGGKIVLVESDTSLSGLLRGTVARPSVEALICSIPLIKPRPATNARDAAPSMIVVPSKDAPTISQALKLALKGNKTVALLPGVYQEAIELTEEMLSDELSSASKQALELLTKKNGGSILDLHESINKKFDLEEQGALNITIRAVDPSQPTIISHCSDEMARAKPTVQCVVGDSKTPADAHPILLTLEGLHVMHSVPGIEIWSANTAIKASGFGAFLQIHDCLITSVSGRGVVVTGGANAALRRSTIYNCAATGLYAGDEFTAISLRRCNVVNNGYGGRPELSPMMTVEPLLFSTPGFLDSIKSSLDNDHEVATSEEGVVPSGHSGIYAEVASVSADDTLISTSCFTGITLVRKGVVDLNGCDVVCNGSDGTKDEDVFLVERAIMNDESLEETKGSSITYGPLPCQILANSKDGRKCKPSDLFRTVR